MRQMLCSVVDKTRRRPPNPNPRLPPTDRARLRSVTWHRRPRRCATIDSRRRQTFERVRSSTPASVPRLRGKTNVCRTLPGIAQTTTRRRGVVTGRGVTAARHLPQVRHAHRLQSANTKPDRDTGASTCRRIAFDTSSASGPSDAGLVPSSPGAGTPPNATKGSAIIATVAAISRHRRHL